MKTRLVFLAGLLLLATTVCAVSRADTIQTFTIQGKSFNYGQPILGSNTPDLNTISGSTSIDITTGVVQSIRFNAGGIEEFGISQQQNYTVYLSDLTTFLFSSFVPLKGYTGSTFNYLGTYDYYSGTVTPAATVTPEPASLLLLATGLLLVFAAAPSRRRCSSPDLSIR